MTPATTFVAPTPAGALRLAAHAASRHALDAALVLHRCEALLAGLEDWTGLRLDWRWGADVAPPDDDGCAVAHWQLGDTLAGTLALPWRLLRALRAPGATLPLLRWPALPAVLAVSSLQLASDELARLEPGGAAVLPDSLLPDWHGLLRADGEPFGHGVPVALPSPAAPRLAPRLPHRAWPAAPLDPDRVACEVRLTTPRLDAGHLAGWREDEPLAGVGPQASLWRCGAEDSRALASGRLMPWGSGWALAIELTHPHSACGAPPPGGATTGPAEPDPRWPLDGSGAAVPVDATVGEARAWT